MHRTAMVEMQGPAPLAGPLRRNEAIANNREVGQRIHERGRAQARTLTRELRQMREFRQVIAGNAGALAVDQGQRAVFAIQGKRLALAQ